MPGLDDHFFVQGPYYSQCFSFIYGSIIWAYLYIA